MVKYLNFHAEMVEKMENWDRYEIFHKGREGMGRSEEGEWPVKKISKIDFNNDNVISNTEILQFERKF